MQVSVRKYGSTVALATILCTALSGCGDSGVPTYRAGGSVKFPDGRPLKAGIVSFQPIDSSVRVSTRGYLREDGSFELSTFKQGDGAIEGEHRVLIMPQGPHEGPQPGKPALRLPIHPRFTRYETSKLRYTVTRYPEKNHFDIVVEPPRR